MKCSRIVIDGVPHDVYKQPVTDPTKNSKRGRLKLIRENGNFKTVADDQADDGDNLVPVFRDGRVLVDQRLDAIRPRAVV